MILNHVEIKKDFANKQILILGDVMLDVYFDGKITRMSPEAPVPVVEIDSKIYKLGGAANVALNIKALGAIPIICSVLGADRDGERIRQLIAKDTIETKGLFIDNSRVSTVKTRIIGNKRHVVRVDEENCHPIDSDILSKIMNFISSKIKSVDALLLQDYNKGFLSPDLISKSIELANKHNVPILVDPKKDNFFEYKNVDLFKPNKKEAEEGLDIEINARGSTNVEEVIKTLKSKLNCKHVLITMSEDGVAVNSNKNIYHIPAFKRNIVDVSGAGDSVISVACLAYAAKYPIKQIAALANLAGGLVCESLGVVPIDFNRLIEESKKIS